VVGRTKSLEITYSKCWRYLLKNSIASSTVDVAQAVLLPQACAMFYIFLFFFFEYHFPCISLLAMKFLDVSYRFRSKSNLIVPSCDKLDVISPVYLIDCL
jgi:hypothetical protein